MLDRGVIAFGLAWALVACSAAPASENRGEGRTIDEGLMVNTGGRNPPVQPLPVCDFKTIGAIVTRNDGVCPTVARNDGLLVGQDGLSWLASKGRYSPYPDDQRLYVANLEANAAITSDMISGAQFFCVYEYEGNAWTLATTTAYDFVRDLRLSGASIAGPECTEPWSIPADHGCPTCGNQVPLPPQ